MEDLTLVAVVATALFFDFTNGFHDTANSIATSVSTRALSPRLAVLSAAILNVAGAFVSFKVAATIATGIVDPAVDHTRRRPRRPRRRDHVEPDHVVPRPALELEPRPHRRHGRLRRSRRAASTVVQWQGLVDKVLIPSLLAPFLGIVGAAALMVALLWIVRRRAPGLVNRVFRRLQLVSGGFVAFTHGTNDAQKTMGIIALALVASGHLERRLRPAAHLGDRQRCARHGRSAPTPAAGGSSRRSGTRIAKLDPPRGFAAQTATAAILWTTAHYGFPVSTTHTISGSVLGAGATRRLNAVRWGVAGNILLAWVMTLPAAALVGAGMERITRMPAGDAVVFGIAAVIAAGFFGAARARQTRRVTLAEA